MAKEAFQISSTQRKLWHSHVKEECLQCVIFSAQLQWWASSLFIFHWQQILNNKVRYNVIICVKIKSLGSISECCALMCMLIVLLDNPCNILHLNEALINSPSTGVKMIVAVSH